MWYYDCKYYYLKPLNVHKWKTGLAVTTVQTCLNHNQTRASFGAILTKTITIDWGMLCVLEAGCVACCSMQTTAATALVTRTLKKAIMSGKNPEVTKGNGLWHHLKYAYLFWLYSVNWICSFSGY